MRKLDEILQKTILFYDGDCGFCNKSVQFILRNQKEKTVYFMALQDPRVIEIGEHFDLKMTDLNTLYLLFDDTMYEKSTAALKVTKFLKWKWKFFNVAFIFPKFLRDKVYDFIAKRRKTIAGEFCYLPNETERKQFL